MPTQSVKTAAVPQARTSHFDEPGPKEAFNRKVKRTVDVLASLVLLTVLSPLFVLVTFVIYALEGGPVFFISTRYVGLDKPSRIVKFRTMVRDASSAKYRLAERFMRDGFLDIPLNCEVYTPIGRILERLQIVELPQLINVLRDGMSLVGNRPLPKQNLELLSKFPGWHDRFRAPAGITGISQVVGKLSLLPEERLDLEVMYGRVFSSGNILKADAYIIWWTVARVLLKNRGINLEIAKSMLERCLNDAVIHTAGVTTGEG